MRMCACSDKLHSMLLKCVCQYTVVGVVMGNHFRNVSTPTYKTNFLGCVSEELALANIATSNL